MKNCCFCPRNCLSDREKQLGFCRATKVPEVASICCHKGEEPPIAGKKGICNIFFAHCNLQCVFCQNYEISRASVAQEKVFYATIESIVDRVEELLPETENMLGFVSPSHYVGLIPEIVEKVHERGLFPTVVYNTNGYDSVESLRMVAPYVDIYLPDFKYMDADLARRYSHAADYPEVAQRALQEMFNQKGSALPIDEGLAFRGMIVRHLVLPGQVDNSIDCLRWMAENLSPNLHLSLMAQYFPPEPLKGALPDELNRTLTQEEYDRVVEAFYDLGFHNGWLQELSSTTNYHPNFAKKDAFNQE